MKTELKTLKDIECFIVNEHIVKYHIKKEAIKWVKERGIQISLFDFKKFSNITEEDLKENKK